MCLTTHHNYHNLQLLIKYDVMLSHKGVFLFVEKSRSWLKNVQLICVGLLHSVQIGLLSLIKYFNADCTNLWSARNRLGLHIAQVRKSYVGPTCVVWTLSNNYTVVCAQGDPHTTTRCSVQLVHSHPSVNMSYIHKHRWDLNIKNLCDRDHKKQVTQGKL